MAEDVLRIFKYNPKVTCIEEVEIVARNFERMLIDDHGINEQSAYRMGWNLAMRIWDEQTQERL